MQNFSWLGYVIVAVALYLLLVSSVPSKIRVILFCRKNGINVKKEIARIEKLFPLSRMYKNYTFIGLSKYKNQCCNCNYLEVAGKLRGCDDEGFGYKIEVLLCPCCGEITKF